MKAAERSSEGLCRARHEGACVFPVRKFQKTTKFENNEKMNSIIALVWELIKFRGSWMWSKVCCSNSLGDLEVCASGCAPGVIFYYSIIIIN